MERTDVVMRNVLKGGICVSTIMLDEPIDGFSFETIVLPHDRGLRRYRTRSEAVKGHMSILSHWAEKSHHLSNERMWARKPQRAGLLTHIFGKAT